MTSKRPIFEETSIDPASQAPLETGLIDASRPKVRRAIFVWLHILLGMLAIMIVVGGLTRLTDSGLSITEWNPIKGALPPMSNSAWLETFQKYQAIPEYQLQNKAMTLSGFKAIYWWEWSHRQVGRVIGLVWGFGFFWFLARRQIPSGWTGRLFLLGVLGGLQGALGWWMVSSGLTGRMVDVASYRLAMHLGLAFTIMGLIAWFSFQLRRGGAALLQARRLRDVRLSRLATILLVLIFAQILLGALVAGIDAGRAYIDWPLMNGQFLPSESFDYTPFWTNFFENSALVQFNHRMLGYTVFLVAVYTWWQSRKSALNSVRSSFNLVMVMVLIQMALGITTVLYAAPWQVAIVHQIGAIALIVLVLRARFMAMYPDTQSIRAGA
ncbi:MAG: heme A synthase [Alphaproteobacteria bacterium]|nr:heme A synthase [Alphaproteobacteria bacterium]